MTAFQTVPLRPQDAADYIRRQIDLMLWIESARHTLAEIEGCRRFDTAFAQTLKEQDIRFPRDWGADESTALEFLQMDIQERVVAMANSAGLR